MVSSMTAFSRQASQDDWGDIVWELRSVNHRFLDISLRLPEQLRALESPTREAIQSRLKRGKVDVVLNYHPGENLPFEFCVNQTMLDQLARLDQQITPQFTHLQTNLTQLLAWQGVLAVKETHMPALIGSAMHSLQQSLDDLLSMRAREGDKLKQFLLGRVATLKRLVTSVMSKVPAAVIAYQQRLTDRFAELQLALNQERLEQEMLFLMQKSDVSEEIQRLGSHLDEVERIVQQGGVIGRRLDFMMQELNREANTLGSKSIDGYVSQIVVEMKVCIEQMREQVQNVE